MSKVAGRHIKGFVNTCGLKQIIVVEQLENICLSQNKCLPEMGGCQLLILLTVSLSAAQNQILYHQLHHVKYMYIGSTLCPKFLLLFECVSFPLTSYSVSTTGGCLWSHYGVFLWMCLEFLVHRLEIKENGVKM